MAIVTSRIISNTLFCWKKNTAHENCPRAQKQSKTKQKQNAWHLSVQVVAEDIIKESFTDHRLCCIRLSYNSTVVRYG